MKTILLVAENEFYLAIRHPLIIIIACILFCIAILNGVASGKLVTSADVHHIDDNDHFLSVGLSNTLFYTAVLLTSMATILGIITISDEKTSGTIHTLITKSLYRRDIMMGKYIGMSAILLLVTIIVVMLCVSMIMIFYGGPGSISEMLIRVGSYIFTLYIINEFSLSIAMLIAIVTNNLFSSLVYAGTLLWFEWFLLIPKFFCNIKLILPAEMFMAIMEGNYNGFLFETLTPYSVWITHSMPLIIFTLAMTITTLLINLIIFNNYET